jgi:hypothetical protein
MNTNPKTLSSRRLTTLLLACGVIYGPLFYVVVAVQAFTRAGFDIRKHPISLLSLGDAGWIQVTNFIVAGLLAMACAAGLRTSLTGSGGKSWGPLLIGISGLGMIIAGIFPPPAVLGFPPGTPDGMPQIVGASGQLHGVGFLLAFGPLITDMFVFGRRYYLVGSRGWGFYSIATGVTTPLLVLPGFILQKPASLSFAFAGIIAFGWVSALAGHQIAQLTHDSVRQPN